MLAMLGAGLAAGLHAATWGMYKDSLYEGFSLRKYLRSIVLGLVVAFVVQAIRPQALETAGGIALLFGLVYVVERLVTEWLKVFLRVEDQSKYFIPMQFAVLGRPVQHRGIRLAAGLAYAAALAASVSLLDRLQGASISSWGAAVLAAGFAGGLCAVGGAWKDAPCEGFQLLKFFRSPLIAAAWGALLALFSTDLVTVGFSALGYSIATIETHKKFLSSDSAPGKFTGKAERFPEMRQHRRRFVPVYVGVWALVLLTIAAAVTTEFRSRGPELLVLLGGGR
jgi:hypothetical protein